MMSVLPIRLKEAREKKGLKQIEAAKKLGISNGTLSGYERNYRDPDTDILNKMANLYDVTVDWLMGRSNDPRLTADQQVEIDKKFKKLYEMFSELPDGPEKENLKQRVLDYAAGLIDSSKGHQGPE